jgi:hypothetical protein
MQIVSAVFDSQGRGYQRMTENMKRSAEARGYEVSIFRLATDPMDEFRSGGDYRVNCYFKPHVVLNALESLEEDVVWVDGDCLVRERFDEILDGCDVAVTLRRFEPNTIRDVYDGYVNAGVMAFRNNAAARSFISAWIAELPRGRADQDALNRVLLNYTDMNHYGEVADVGGCRVKFLSCDVYNFFYFPEDHSGAKILHVKGHLRPEFYEACLCSVN